MLGDIYPSFPYPSLYAAMGLDYESFYAVYAYPVLWPELICPQQFITLN